MECKFCRYTGYVKVSSTDESAHHFDKVTVDPTCDANGFTEERCTDADCGIVKADTKEDTDQESNRTSLYQSKMIFIIQKMMLVIESLVPTIYVQNV